MDEAKKKPLKKSTAGLLTLKIKKCPRVEMYKNKLILVNITKTIRIDSLYFRNDDGKHGSGIGTMPNKLINIREFFKIMFLYLNNFTVSKGRSVAMSNAQMNTEL